MYEGTCMRLWYVLPNMCLAYDVIFRATYDRRSFHCWYPTKQAQLSSVENVIFSERVEMGVELSCIKDDIWLSLLTTNLVVVFHCSLGSLKRCKKSRPNSSVFTARRVPAVGLARGTQTSTHKWLCKHTRLLAYTLIKADTFYLKSVLFRCAMADRQKALTHPNSPSLWDYPLYVPLYWFHK